MTDTAPLTDQRLRDRIAESIRPNMLIGLQDAELHDEPGKERINEWADWIGTRVAELVQPELDRLRADRDFWERRYRDESRTCWDAGLPPGGECCADCGQPVESEPCPEHNPGAVAERLRAEVEQWRQLYHCASERAGIAVRVEEVRAELDRLAAQVCVCYPHPADHETDCPRAAAPSA